MPAINFQSQFAPLVENGSKRQTIRKVRKHPIKVGDMLYLYEGLRTPKARRLLTARCSAVYEIGITRNAATLVTEDATRILYQDNEFARADGFDYWSQMIAWFDKQYGPIFGGLPFYGVLIRW